MLSKPEYALGTRAFGEHIVDDDAAEIAEAMQRDLDRALALREGEPRRKPLRIVHARLLRGARGRVPAGSHRGGALGSAASADARAQFVASHASWRERAGDGSEREAERATHNAIGGEARARTRVHRGDALCELVYRLLRA